MKLIFVLIVVLAIASSFFENSVRADDSDSSAIPIQSDDTSDRRQSSNCKKSGKKVIKTFQGLIEKLF